MSAIKWDTTLLIYHNVQTINPLLPNNITVDRPQPIDEDNEAYNTGQDESILWDTTLLYILI